MLCGGIPMIVGGVLLIVAINVVTLPLYFVGDQDYIKEVYPDEYRKMNSDNYPKMSNTAIASFDQKQPRKLLDYKKLDNKWSDQDFETSRYSRSMPIISSNISGNKNLGTSFVVTENLKNPHSLCSVPNKDCKMYIITSHHVAMGNSPKLFIKDIVQGESLDNLKKHSCKDTDISIFEIDTKTYNKLELRPFAHLISGEKKSMVAFGNSTSPVLGNMMPIHKRSLKIYKNSTNGEILNYINAGEMYDLSCEDSMYAFEKTYSGTALIVPLNPIIKHRLKDYASYQYVNSVGPYAKYSQLRMNNNGSSDEDCRMKPIPRHIDYLPKKSALGGNYFLQLKIAQGMSGSPLLHNPDTNFPVFQVLGMASSYHKLFQNSQFVSSNRILSCIEDSKKNIAKSDLKQEKVERPIVFRSYKDIKEIIFDDVFKNKNIFAVGHAPFGNGGVSEYVDGGVSEYVDGGVSEYVDGGVSEYVDGGVSEYVDGGVSEYVDGGVTNRLFYGNRGIFQYNHQIIGFSCELEGNNRYFWADWEMINLIKSGETCWPVFYKDVLSGIDRSDYLIGKIIDNKKSNIISFDSCSTRNNSYCLKLKYNKENDRLKINFYKDGLFSSDNMHLTKEVLLNDLLFRPILSIKTDQGIIHADFSALFFINYYQLYSSENEDLETVIDNYKPKVVMILKGNNSKDDIPFNIIFNN